MGVVGLLRLAPSAIAEGRNEGRNPRLLIERQVGLGPAGLLVVVQRCFLRPSAIISYLVS